ncbi:hypothetical protein D3C75_1307390 [compost metagenome]
MTTQFERHFFHGITGLLKQKLSYLSRTGEAERANFWTLQQARRLFDGVASQDLEYARGNTGLLREFGQREC